MKIVYGIYISIYRILIYSGRDFSESQTESPGPGENHTRIIIIVIVIILAVRNPQTTKTDRRATTRPDRWKQTRGESFFYRYIIILSLIVGNIYSIAYCLYTVFTALSGIKPRVYLPVTVTVCARETVSHSKIHL